MLSYESGGSGSHTVLLLHGLGATGAVWQRVSQALGERGGVRWLAVDLSGHGGSPWQPFYSVGQMTVELAPLVRQCGGGELTVLGHSLGAFVGLALASGWFGVEVRAVLGIGPKIAWPAADVQAARELAARPVRWYATREEATARYRRVSGLSEDIAPGEECLARGTVQGEQGWRLSQDPRSFAVAGAPFGSLARSAGRVLLARGERDHMVSLEELRMHASQAVEIQGVGHNAHVEDPRAVVALLERLLTVASSCGGG